MKTLTRTAASVAVLAGAIALAGCSNESGPVAGTAAPTKTTTSTPTPTPTPDAKVGTRANPFAVGAPGKHSSDSVWTFTWDATNGDGWAEIQKANEYNEAPAAGQSFVLSSTTVGAGAGVGAEGGDPVASFTISYVGSDGNTYPAVGDCGVLPGKAVYEIGRMYANASQKGYVCSVVPTEAVVGGTWNVQALVGSGTAFFAGA